MKFSGGMENVYGILQVIMQVETQQHMTVLWELNGMNFQMVFGLVSLSLSLSLSLSVPFRQNLIYALLRDPFRKVQGHIESFSLINISSFYDILLERDELKNFEI
jgi:hypothetical protein